MNDLADAILIDLEATGADPAVDRITSIALLRYDRDERDGLPFSCLVNPGRPIPPNVAELTGLTDASVAFAPPFLGLAAHIAELIHDRPLIGFGLTGFDVPLLAEEFERAGVEYRFGPVIDAGGIFKKQEPRTLSAAVTFYLGQELVHAHQSIADAEAAGDVLLAQLGRYALTEKSVAELVAHGRITEHPFADPFGKLSRIDGHVCFNTHRNRGVRVSDDIGYANWMLRSDFPMATKRILEAELERIYYPPTSDTEQMEDAIAKMMAGPDDRVQIPF